MNTGMKVFFQLEESAAPVGIYTAEGPFFIYPCQCFLAHLGCCLDRMLLLPRLAFTIILTHSAKSWDYGYVSPNLAFLYFIKQSSLVEDNLS